MKLGLERLSSLPELTRRLVVLLGQLFSRVESIENTLSDVFKSGVVINNTDSLQSFTFTTPFIAGQDSDISVVLNRQVAGAAEPLYAINITKTGFDIDRVDTIGTTDIVNYIAINGFYT